MRTKFHFWVMWAVFGGMGPSCAYPEYDAARGSRAASTGASGSANAGRMGMGDAGRGVGSSSGFANFTAGTTSAGGLGGEAGASFATGGSFGGGGTAGEEAQGGTNPTGTLSYSGASGVAMGGANTRGGTSNVSIAGKGGIAAGAGRGATAGGGVTAGGTSSTRSTAPGGASVQGGASTSATTATGGTSAACAATDRRCSGAQLLRCNAARTAVDELVAACASAALCQSGLASGACTPQACSAGSYTCQNSSRVPCKADLTGYDQANAVPCSDPNPVCFDGSCVTCANSDRDCLAGVPRQCVSHAWTTGTACTALEACAVGDCVNARMARWKMPNEPGSAYNPASYQLAASNTVVRDLVTGLEWQAGVSPSEVNAGSSAEQYCQSLSLGGHRDFRMPTAIELFSLVDFSIASGLRIDASVFSNTPTLLIAKESFLAVSFETGAIQREVTTGLSYVIRCVRSTVGASASARYGVSGTSVTDNYTGLVWNQTNDKAMVYGSTFRSTGCPAPKRVPTVKELMTLVDRSITTPPLIDATAFTGTKSDYYWSVTGAGPGYMVSFDDGSIQLNSLSTDGVGRCLLQ